MIISLLALIVVAAWVISKPVLWALRALTKPRPIVNMLGV